MAATFIYMHSMAQIIFICIIVFNLRITRSHVCACEDVLQTNEEEKKEEKNGHLASNRNENESKR